MTGRDMRWRAAGLALSVGACAATSVERDGSPWTILYFIAAIVGIVLMLHGKRVPVALKAERRGHRDTAAAIHAERLRHGRGTPRA